MPINASPFYAKAEKEFLAAQTPEERLQKLKEMLTLAPKHKGAQNLLSELKLRIAKCKEIVEKNKVTKKGAYSLSIKKQGAAQITLVGTTNTGKSTLLKQLTNSHVKISDVPFTTTKPVQGMLDYKGIKLQIVEIPAITKNYIETSLGPTNLSIARQSDLLILMFNNKKELDLIKKELKYGEVNVPLILFKNQKNLPYLIWKKLKLIKIYTKQQGKKPTYPPLALKKGAIIKDLAEHVHKDFIKKLKYARIWGKSAKFEGQEVGLNHKLEDDDIVELHIK
jgi:small GTP-binding protein